MKIERCGKHRILHLVNGSASNGLITTLAVADWPKTNISNAAAIVDSTRANVYITVSASTGEVKLWQNTDSLTATGKVQATIDWYTT